MYAKWIAPLFGALLLVATAAASAQIYTGRFDDPGNAALVASDLGAATFNDVFAIANNVAMTSSKR